MRRGAVLRLSVADDERVARAERSRVGYRGAKVLGRVVSVSMYRSCEGRELTAAWGFSATFRGAKSWINRRSRRRRRAHVGGGERHGTLLEASFERAGDD